MNISSPLSPSPPLKEKYTIKERKINPKRRNPKLLTLKRLNITSLINV
jgi:hypothetical protein